MVTLSTPNSQLKFFGNFRVCFCNSRVKGNDSDDDGDDDDNDDDDVASVDDRGVSYLTFSEPKRSPSHIWDLVGEHDLF